MQAMSGFDAELYLRLAGERGILGEGGEQHGPEGTRLAAAARALVAVGAVDLDLAQTIVDEYGMAMALRSGGHYHRGMRPRHHVGGHGRRTAVIKPRRIVPCFREIQQPSGTLQIRSVTLDDDGTSVAIRFVADRQRPRPRALGGHGAFGGGGPPQKTLTDDRGRTETADFSGGWSDHEWHGRFSTTAPLARDTAWIEIDGERIELSDQLLAAEVSVELLPEQDPAFGHLWACVASGEEFHDPDMEPAIEALVASGSVAAHDPQVDDVRAVAVELSNVYSMRGHGRRRRLPEPWRSLIAGRGRTNGPTGIALANAVTPEFDGITVAVMSIDSSSEQFEAVVEVVPDYTHAMPFDADVDPMRLVWWAADDRGNHYLGRSGQWSSDGESGRGDIVFTPPLDPRATRLDVIPTARTSRAVIRIPLLWTPAPGAGES